MSSKPQFQDGTGRLVAEIARLWRTRLDSRLQPMGLSQARWRILFHLSEAGEGGLTQRELAERYGVEAPTMANLIDRLEKEGWVARRVSAQDRRCKTCVLTPKSELAADTVYEEADQLSKLVRRNISAKELRACESTLEKLRLNLLELI